MMKKSIIISVWLFSFCLGFGTSVLRAQGPNFFWAQQSGGSGVEWGLSIASDSYNNCIVTGFFENSSVFGDTTLTSAGFSDIYVTKLSDEGNFLWVQQAGGLGYERGNSIATDNSDNCLVTGFFVDVATFSDTSLISAGGFGDIFLAKYSSMGELLWARQAGGKETDFGNDIVVDNDGNSIITGVFRDTVMFDSINIVSSGEDDIFLSKYDANGHLLWVQQAGGASFDEGMGLEIDYLGSIIATGIFSGTATFGNITLVSAGSNDVFLAKYDPDGNIIWARRIGGWRGLSLATDNSGDIYVVGDFFGTEIFDNITLTSAGSTDMFVAKYDPNGNTLWARSAGGMEADTGVDANIDISGRLLIAGIFEDVATFDGITLTSAGFADVFIAQYSSGGGVLWVQKAGGEFNDQGLGIATDTSGYTYVTGDFGGTATFGDTTLTGFGNSDIFIAKMDSGIVTGIENEKLIPHSISLSQNYPNPFNSTTVIKYSLLTTDHVNLTIYNSLGQRVRKLIDQLQAPDYHQVEWNGQNDEGINVPSGIYLYRLQVGSIDVSKKMVLLR